ncbi:ATP-dependent helicase [Streptomyces filamentosus NRRL 15998]|uniref:RNA helicase n=1 Tax=Streptomyces filamentosus NRRL 15998 TaxID=457431 RepID=D6AQN1_STRFL|nr:ATP-dependent helicase [Streptomyces filamentosus NRRL 15998]
MSTSFADLQSQLGQLSLRDANRLGRRLEGARRIRKPEARQSVLDEIAAEAGKAADRLAARAARLPALSYPEELPVSQKKDEILEAIRDHQVVIVAGETGSGKTTQIPKICMELGRGVRGMIGHTQPRRIAARTVAERVADELKTPLGETVGWKVRFTDQVNPESTYLKLMTDGILLAEIQTDRELLAYDTIIIDEAHERSLNIDFLLGYLARLLPRRPDLKVVITSATIDPERFARHFGDAPIVEVSGRTYPVEVRYRPLLEEDSEDSDRDQITAICDAVDELGHEAPGDVLVFLSGEREIRDTADALNKRNLRHTEVLPLYARLSHAEQHRVFQRHTGRRIVLATNVAETSLTVPGIKYVIDPGNARISRYSHRTKVQRLPIERISQASANQCKGRCGRTSDGICIRLYSEDDFVTRPEFTDPEILRTNLASVILQMTAAGLGDIEKFPFIDPPDHRNIRDGVQLLQELGALEQGEKSPQEGKRGQRLTPLGRKLSQLPVDPRLARMVIEADKNGCVREVMVIAAALSIQDPRERPAEKQTQADQNHARFKDETSDFLAYLNLWAYVREQQKERGSSSFRRMCKQEYLNFLRIREWQDIYAQLRTVAKQMGITVEEPKAEASVPEQAVHTSLLAGLLSHIGLKDTEKNEYLGARSAKFAIFPGSALFKKQPRFLMSAELVETSRLWARVNAKVEPEWIEPLAHAPGEAHLQRTALGEGPGGGDGVRAGHPLRRADRRPAQGQFRTYRPGGLAGSVHPQRPGRGRLAHPPPVLPRQPQTARRGRGVGAPGPSPRHPRGRRDPLRLLRPAHPGAHRLRRALRLLVETQEARGAGRARLRALHAHQRKGRGRHQGRLPGLLAAGEAQVQGDVPVRARRGRGRCDGARPAPGAQPGHRRGLRLADPGAARGGRHRADPLAAEADPPALRPRPELRGEVPRPGRPAPGAAAADPGA